MKILKVLIACEESQRVCTEFRKLGHEAYSADIQEPSGGHPEWHILGDVLNVLRGGRFTTMARRGRTKEYIRHLYDEMCLLFSTPDMFGKRITMTDIMHSLEKEYGIDWGKLQVNIESESEWIHGVRKG